MTDRNGQPDQLKRDAHVVLSCWPRLLSVALAANYLGLAVQTVRNRAGEIPGRKRLGRKVVYDRNVLDRWIDRNNGRTDLFLDGVRLLK